MTYPVLETNSGESVRLTFRIVPTADGKYGVTMSDSDSDSLVTVCVCETPVLAASIQRMLYNHHKIEAMAAQARTERPTTGLSDLWQGGLPNWKAEPFLPGECIRCGRQTEVTGYVYKNASGGYTLLGALCWTCCEQITEQLLAGGTEE